MLSLLACQYRYGSDAHHLSVTDITSRSGLSHASVSKILKMLASEELVLSVRGKNGGYCLNKEPEEISVAAIIEALEGPIALTACVETSSDPCASKQSCFLSGHWERVNGVIGEALRGMTLADLIDPEQYFKIAAAQSHQSITMTSDATR